MAEMINRAELISSIVNRQAPIPDYLQYRDFKAFLDGYTKCQHDILDIVRDAPAVANQHTGSHICYNCGAVIRDDDIYCWRCGRRMPDGHEVG